MSWNESDIPDQAGRTIIVTGANSGIGLEAAEMLAGKGAFVVLACRNVEKGHEAEARILGAHPDAKLEVRPLDLSSLASVRAFADAFTESHARLDVLINNAGVMALPYRKTEDGFEMQIGTNHLGHFALTGRLFARLESSQPARVVSVSSAVHRVGKINFGDLQSTKRYSRWPAYAQSKLANLYFTKELARRASAKGVELLAVACHPGYASTNLQAGGARMTGSTMKAGFMTFANGLLAQSAKMGALPTVYGAVAEGLSGGDFIGPGGLMALTGSPKREQPHPRVEDQEVARRLWEVSEELTGVSFPI